MHLTLEIAAQTGKKYFWEMCARAAQMSIAVSFFRQRFFFPHFLRGVGGKVLNRPFQKVNMHINIYLRKPRCFRNSLFARRAHSNHILRELWLKMGQLRGIPRTFSSDGFNALQRCGWVRGGPGIPPSELAWQAPWLHSLL